MPKNKKAQSTVKDLMIIAIFIFSLSALILSVFAVHTVKNYDEKISSYNNANAINGYSLFKISDIIDRMIHGKEHSVNEENNNNEEMFHPREYKYNGPLTQQQVVEQTPAYHILKDIYTLINGKYYPISTKEGYINGSFISGDLDKINSLTANKVQTKELCLNGKCTTTTSGSQKLVLKKENGNTYICIQPNGNCVRLPTNNQTYAKVASLTPWYIGIYEFFGDAYETYGGGCGSIPNEYSSYFNFIGIPRKLIKMITTNKSDFCIYGSSWDRRYCLSSNIYTYEAPYATGHVVGIIATATIMATKDEPNITIFNLYYDGYAVYLNGMLIAQDWWRASSFPYQKEVVKLPLKRGQIARLTIYWYNNCASSAFTIKTDGIKVGN